MNALEERMAHLIRAMDDLSDVVARQQKEIDGLTHRVRILIEREAEREQSGGGGLIFGDEKPPHY